MLKYIRITWRLLSISIQLVAEYRTSFFLITFSITLWIFVSFFWVIIAYSFTNSFAGYSLWQYIGFVGFYFFAVNLFWFFFETSLNALSQNIYEGKVDIWILKPTDSQFLASINEFDLPSLFNVLFGFIVFVISVIKLGITITFLHVCTLFLVVILSIVAMYSIMFIAYSLTFWAGRLNAFVSFMNTIYHETSNIPSTAYQGVIRLIFYFVIPVALIATIPTSTVYFKIEWNLLIYYILFTTFVFFLSRLIWLKGLRSYSSVSG